MTMYKGSNQLSSLNVGGTEIGQVYKGNELVWEKEEPTNVELIQRSYDETLETLVILKANKSYIIEFVNKSSVYRKTGKNYYTIGAFLKTLIIVDILDIVIKLRLAYQGSYVSSIGIWLQDNSFDCGWVGEAINGKNKITYHPSSSSNIYFKTIQDQYYKESTKGISYSGPLSQSESYYDEYYGLISSNPTYYGSPTSGQTGVHENGYIHIYSI